MQALRAEEAYAHFTSDASFLLFKAMPAGRHQRKGYDKEEYRKRKESNY
jgi:hypothetical protein